MYSGRQPSARPQSRFNPITGEEMPYTGRTPNATDIYQQYNSTKTNAAANGQAPSTKVPQRQSPPQKGAVVQDIRINRPPSRPHSRPQGVPHLRLGNLEDKDEDRVQNMDPYDYKLDTPDSASTVSWGTPRSSYSQCRVQELQLDLTPQASGRSTRGAQQPPASATSGRDGAPVAQAQQRAAESARNSARSQQSAWDRDPIPNPESVAAPTERHREQYRQMSAEMHEAYKLQNIDAYLQETTIRDKIEALRLDIPQYGGLEDEVDTDDQQKSWTQQPYSKMAQIRKADVEYLEAENRKKKLIETVMIDQLSRFPVCDPEQDAALMEKPPDYTVLKKGSYRRLHNTKIRTPGTATENLLSKRIHFGARILSRCGRDSVRELTGFYFAADNSITIYEFRQFGKTGKALPFIKRGIYKHLHGRRKAENFSLLDILQGNTLVFLTQGQPLPESLLTRQEIAFRITDVDDTSKASVLLSSVDVGDRENVWRNAHLPPTKQEINDRLVAKQVHDIVREQIKKRGIRVWTGLGRYYRKLLEGPDAPLSKFELEKGLVDFHIEVPQELSEDLWEQLDTEATSFLPYERYMRAALGEMNETRKALVRKAFMKIDASKSGVISKEEMKKFYNAHKHPKVVARECREEQVLAMFMENFDGTRALNDVTYEEFEEYYEGLSVAVESDSDFANILRNAWGI